MTDKNQSRRQRQEEKTRHREKQQSSQHIRSSSATLSRQRILSGLDAVLMSKRCIANTCQRHCSAHGSQMNTWYQRTPWAAAYSVLNNGNNIWKLLSQNGKSSHLQLRRRHLALRAVLAPPPELRGGVQGRKQRGKARNTSSALLFWNMVVCGAKTFLATY